MDNREWTDAYRNIMPLVTLSVAMTSLGLGIIRSLPEISSRVRYRDSSYLVAVRGPGEWHDIREFVQPYNAEIQRICSQIGYSVNDCLGFVCENIDYRKDIGEHWAFPSETLRRGKGDCEDTSNLLCSLLDNFVDAHVVLGDYCGYGHAWVEVNSTILESTYTRARPVADRHNYCPYVYFNDVEVVELWSGALDEIYRLRRDESRKLGLMAQSLDLTTV